MDADNLTADEEERRIQQARFVVREVTGGGFAVVDTLDDCAFARYPGRLNAERLAYRLNVWAESEQDDDSDAACIARSDRRAVALQETDPFYRSQRT